MAAATVSATDITRFSDMVHVKSQQMKARLKPFVTVQHLKGDDFAYDGLGDVEAREINGVIVENTFDDINHTRRQIKRRRFIVNLPIDARNVRGQLLNAEGHYAEASVRAMARVFDRVGVEAAFADVKTGRLFDTTVTYAGDGGLTVNATAGATYETLLEADTNFINNEVGTDTEERMIMLITGDESDSFLQELELTSGDYSRRFQAENGKMQRALDFQLIKYGADVANPILNVSGGTRDCIIMVDRALHYKVSKEMSVTIQDRPDYVELKQVQIIGELGAVRTEGVLMQKYQTTAA